ncbi:phosphatase PAP2 family protein [Novosphingobium sp. G106]|uniref:phosphatase PAP2 family protein n=1 Tax=Novosphingobium sp. G106 TaxID=2849500 RepID=UPI001C2DCE7B|nr:phosphatase PAP2 family protein [Novosphingobium sp. G106]MBV1691593.1 phosphatase PAP2 family protein [Novosphingobium sp. G106]
MKAIFLSFAVLALPAIPTLAQAQAVAPVATAPKPPTQFQYLNPADFEPARLLPAPPAKGSPAEKLELETLRALIASASTARLEQAKWDAAHEDSAIFSTTIGRDITKLPATWELLEIVHSEANIAAGLSKVYFGRTRPWGLDPALHDCEGKPNANPLRGYPSGHATLSYSVGYVLAQLLPGQASAILAKADDYARSREYCASHFASDTAASHVVGTLAAVRLLADPRLADRVAAARAELAAH